MSVMCLFCASSATADDRLDLIRKSKRVVFLGDSITYAGGYVAFFDAWLLTQKLESRPTIIDVGLPSETVSGLSEEGHAGGRFPRPDLEERLDRVLAATKPDLVFACYGINCGIYKPFDEKRFEAYRKGILKLKKKVEAGGATLVVITPPTYDDKRSKNKFSYNEVLDRYSEWLVEQRKMGWLVIDLHSAMTKELVRQREKTPGFTFQPDAVHPNGAGHWYMASQLIGWFGDEKAAGAENASKMLEAAGVPAKALTLVRQRLDLRRNAYLSAAGHKRPGIRKGLPVAEAEAKAKEVSAKLAELVK